MKLKGAQIIVETLIEQGASTVFGYPGGQVIDIYDALYLAQDRIHHIITAHEQGAAHAADGYARATGEVGVVIATSGPVRPTWSPVSLPHIWTPFPWLPSPATCRTL